MSSIVVGYQLDPADPCPSVLVNLIALRMDLGYWSCGHSACIRFYYGNYLSDLLFSSSDLFALLEIAVWPSDGDLELLNLNCFVMISNIATMADILILFKMHLPNFTLS